MTHLRKMMLEELQRRNYAETTISSYIRIVEDFSRRFQRPPDCLGPKHIREYQSELSRSESWRQAPLRSILRLFGSSIPRLSRGAGAWPRLPIRKEPSTFPRF